MRRRDLIEHLSSVEANGDRRARLTVDSAGRSDAQTMPFFARQVEQIQARTYEREFRELKAANGTVLPISSDIDEGAETFTYYTYEPRGVADFISAYGDHTLPEVTIAGAEVTRSVRDYGVQYGWTTKDIRRAAFARSRGGKDLRSSHATAARRAADELFHRTILWGDETRKLDGFVTHPNITVSIAADNGSGSTRFADKTLQQVLADFGTMIHGTIELTNEVIAPNKCAIALSVYHLLMRRKDVNDNKSFLTHIQETFPGVDFYPLIDLESTAADNTVGQAMAIAYVYDAEKCDAVEPMGFTQYAPQQDGLRWIVPCEASIGGVRMPEPLSVHRMDGID